MKRKTSRKKPAALLSGFAPAKLMSMKLPGVDLGALQSDFIAAGRSLKSAATKLANAQDAFDVAKTKQANASEKLKSASRTVIADA